MCENTVVTRFEIYESINGPGLINLFHGLLQINNQNLKIVFPMISKENIYLYYQSGIYSCTIF